MNSFKKFLIVGIALVNTNYCSISYGAELRIGTGLEISGNDTSINHPIIVENTKFNGEDGNSQIANLTFGKEDENYDAHKITLEKNSVINQTNTGHIHVYDNLQVDPGATIKTTLYNEEHVNMLHDFDRGNINTAGFDIHGSLKEKDGEPINGGSITFEKGSKIELTDNQDPKKYPSPAFYLCNGQSRINVSNLLTKIDKDDTDEYKKSKETLFHVIGTIDEAGNRKGTVDIFTSLTDWTDGVEDIITKKIQEIGDNNVVIENAKINIPVYNFEIIDSMSGSVAENQKIKITALEQAQEIGEADGEKIYDTADKTDKIVGLDIDLTKEPDITNTLKILKNNYIYNKEGKDYTVLTNSHLDPNTTTDEDVKNASTGIKIKPKINDADDLNKIFSLNIIDTKQIYESAADIRPSILEFIRSIVPVNGNDTGSKIKIYNSELESDYLNNKKYTLDLDKVNSDISPFKCFTSEDDENAIDLTDLKRWYSSKDKPVSTLPIYVNLKGQNPNAFKLPSSTEEGGETQSNQIQEIDFFGNNSKFNQHIDLIEENITGDTDTHVNKLVFDENSFVRTNRPTVNQQFPINWEFIGRNNNVYQNNESYAAKINCPLTTLVVNNKNNKNSITVQLNNPNNKSAFNSYLYVNEIYNIPSETEQAETPEKPYTSLIISDNYTVRLVNKEKNISEDKEFIPRKIIISHIDNIPSITEFDAELDPVVKYVPTSRFLQATNNLEEQLQKYEYDIDKGTDKKKYSIECYTSIPKAEFENLEFPVGDNNTNVALDLTVAFDEESGKSKISFYNIMEYVYNKEYNKQDYTAELISKDNDEITEHNAEFSAKHPHLFIPLYRYQNKTNQYYFLTNFEIFPGFTKDTLITNFNNARKDKIKLNTIIPNIYMGNNIIQFKDDSEIDFGKENEEFLHAKYAVYTKSTSSN